MNFLLSDEQIQLQTSLGRVLESACDSRRLHAAIDSAEGIDRALWTQLVDYGVTGMGVPERFGGLGLEMIDVALAAEMLGRFAAPVPFLGHALACVAITLGGDEALQAAWLPRLASGEVTGAVAFEEGPDAWLPDQWGLSLDDGLDGAKRHVPNALEADVVVVGLKGGELALVDLKDPGVERRRMGGVDLTRRLDEIRFENAVGVRLPSGRAASEKLRDAALVLLAADAYGGAARCVEMAVAYANQREQFGVAISHFQAVRHQLANMALETEPCRGLYWYAAHAFDHMPDVAGHAAALAKAHICERFLQVSRDNIEIHGGVGYTWDYDPHIWLKRAMFDWAWLGAPQLHRARAAELAGW